MSPHPCLRDNAFKLKPLEMSDTLISQLYAVELKLGEEAGKLQKLVKLKKNKHKHYKEIIIEASRAVKLSAKLTRVSCKGGPKTKLSESVISEPLGGEMASCGQAAD